MMLQSCSNKPAQCAAPEARCGWPDLDSSLSSAATARESRLYSPSRTASMTGCPGLRRCGEEGGRGKRGW